MQFYIPPDYNVNLSELETWKVDSNQVNYIKSIAKGAYGEVWFGTFNGEQVAIKSMREYKREVADIKKFVDEILLMARYVTFFIA